MPDSIVDNGFARLRTRIEEEGDFSTFAIRHMPDDLYGCVMCGIVVWDRVAHADRCPRKV